jgi:hypothetical protein
MLTVHVSLAARVQCGVHMSLELDVSKLSSPSSVPTQQSDQLMEPSRLMLEAYAVQFDKNTRATSPSIWEKIQQQQ